MNRSTALLRNAIAAASAVLTLQLAACAIPVRADMSVGASVRIAPPPIPVYDQPLCPGDGYIWTPGYWGWDAVDYYWVPGVWVLPPQPGYLWTPGYWEFIDGGYLFHQGYWGLHVGFYGGIDYGFGYGGHGFDGGYWSAGHFHYNRAVTRVNETIVQNVYTNNVVNNVTINRASFNGGSEGVQAKPTAAERQVEHERHLPMLAEQTHHAAEARGNPQMHARANQGRPPIPAARADALRNIAAPVRHARDLPSQHEDAGAGLEASARAERERMYARQNSERVELQLRQDADHERLDREQASAERRQQMEIEHQRQTNELAQRHAQEERRFYQRHPRRTERPNP